MWIDNLGLYNECRGGNKTKHNMHIQKTNKSLDAFDRTENFMARAESSGWNTKEMEWWCNYSFQEKLLYKKRKIIKVYSYCCSAVNICMSKSMQTLTIDITNNSYVVTSILGGGKRGVVGWRGGWELNPHLS